MNKKEAQEKLDEWSKVGIDPEVTFAEMIKVCDILNDK